MITESEISKFETYTNVKTASKNDIYKDSAFKIIKDLSSKKKGAIFEKIFEEYMTRNGHTIFKPESSEHDRIVQLKDSDEKLKIEIKGSFLWGDGDKFRFQQIRTNQDYDYVVFLAVYTDTINFYIASKEDPKKNHEVQDEDGNWIYNQHGGKKVNSGTFWIDGFPEDISWMQELEW